MVAKVRPERQRARGQNESHPAETSMWTMLYMICARMEPLSSISMSTPGCPEGSLRSPRQSHELQPLKAYRTEVPAAVAVSRHRRTGCRAEQATRACMRSTWHLPNLGKLSAPAPTEPPERSGPWPRASTSGSRKADNHGAPGEDKALFIQILVTP